LETDSFIYTCVNDDPLWAREGLTDSKTLGSKSQRKYSWRSASETSQEGRKDGPICRGTHLPGAQRCLQTPKIAPSMEFPQHHLI